MERLKCDFFIQKFTSHTNWHLHKCMPLASLIMSTYHCDADATVFPTHQVGGNVNFSWISVKYLLPWVESNVTSERSVGQRAWDDLFSPPKCRLTWREWVLQLPWLLRFSHLFWFFLRWAHRPTHFASKIVDGLSRFQSRVVSCCWWSSCTGLRLSCAAAPAHHPNWHCF